MKQASNISLSRYTLGCGDMRASGRIPRACGALCALALGLSACSSEPAGVATSGNGGAPTTAGVAGTTGGATAMATGGVPSATGGMGSGTGGTASVTGGLPGTAGSTVLPTGGSVAAAGSGSDGTVGPGTGGVTPGTGGAAGGGSGIPGTGGASGNGGGGAGGPATGGVSPATGGQGGAPVFERPEGTIPNQAQPPSTVNLPKGDWEKGLISPSMEVGHQINQPSVVNGYLVVGGNEEFWIYDVSDPTAPDQLSEFTTPGRTGGEAESHTVSFARYGDTFYMVTIGGKGIDIWDVSSASSPDHVSKLAIPGANYGDYTEAVWGVSWQGQYIYVGATNNGIKVVNVADPAAPAIVAEVPTNEYGGVSAGPLDAIGNVLVVTTPKESGGVATLDISNPAEPVRLASLSTGTSYIGQFYRHWVFLITPVRAWDVLSDPENIGSGSQPVGNLPTDGSEYLSFSDDYLFLGHVRAEIGGTPGASKISVANPASMQISSRIWGRMDLGDVNDDQFNIALGNLLLLGDDQAPYAGWVLAVHQTDPDTTPPVVDTVIPKPQSSGVSIQSRIGVTFSDNIELATVSAASFIVRPVGGQPLSGKFGLRMGVVNFDPDQDLLPGTTYEVVLPQGGLTDLVGNALTAEWKSTFTTE